MAHHYVSYTKPSRQAVTLDALVCVRPYAVVCYLEAQLFVQLPRSGKHRLKTCAAPSKTPLAAGTEPNGQPVAYQSHANFTCSATTVKTVTFFQPARSYDVSVLHRDRTGPQLLTLVAVALSTNVLVGSSDRWRPVFVTAILGVVVACEVRRPESYVNHRR